MDEKIKKTLIHMQKNEITEQQVYKKLAKRVKDKNNREIIARIAADEKMHAEYLKNLTGVDVKPNKFKIYWFSFISLVFGLSFGLKLMERGEDVASKIYHDLSDEIEGIEALSLDEQKHEKELLGMLEEERLEYAGSMVLGLNDALVELTGALAGLTFALQNSRLIALAGLITGIAASLSMAASGYLSSKEEEEQNEAKSPIKAAIYTGAAYIITVAVLIAPYFIFENVFVSLGVTLAAAVLIIFLYTFYITTAKGTQFWPRFVEMVVISLSIAVISFGVGIVLKKFLGIEV
ncbi:MAG: VIT1/CCC1 transporter family protein [Calditrichia bacterium]|nr:VIT1/CCC1 transporter family protein [Calditrichia bacterium]